jgi:hypothetical protein
MNKENKARIIALLNDVKPDDVRKALKVEFAELTHELANAVNREINQRIIADHAAGQLHAARSALIPFGKLMEQWLNN